MKKEIPQEPDAIAGYVRLSRAEMSEAGTFEEKIERHKRILLRLAEAYHIPLSEEQIVVEIKTGEKLATRPGLLEILDQARRGKLKVVVAMAVDRLTRSVVDQAPIADAFFTGETLLVTQEGRTLFDQHLDLTPWQLKALLAEWERDRCSFRRKVHNEERASRGQRSSGYAPLGYVWKKAVSSDDGRTIVRPGHYEVIDKEYEIVVELFQRIWREGISAIQRDFNVRFKQTGHPVPPSHGRREDRAASWNSSTLYRILANPHYCGFPAHRQAMHRGKGRTKLPQSDWVFAATEQDYPHPLAGLEAWYELQALLHSRRSNFGGAIRRGVLTRLLKCPNGQSMRSGGENQYACTCRNNGHVHPGSYVTASRVELVALTVLKQAFAALPLDALPITSVDPDRKALVRQRGQALQARAEQEHLANELMKNATLLITLYGEADFRKKAEANKQALDLARQRVADIEAQLEQPDLAEKKALLQRIASIGGGDVRKGTERLWQVADYAQRREMVQHVIAEMRMRPAAARWKHCREIEVAIHPFYARYYTPPVFSIGSLLLQSAPREPLAEAPHCLFCGTAVRRPPSQQGWERTYCNRHCYNAWRAQNRGNDLMETYRCDQCGREFPRKPSLAKRRKRHFCGRDCFRAFKKGKPFTAHPGQTAQDEGEHPPDT